MGVQLNVTKGQVRAVSNRVLVSDMYFGEQKTSSGIVLTSDDGKTRGIYPRWAKVYCKGPQNKDPYEVGQWILIEHGRWTRGFKIDDGSGEQELRMVEAESILAYADERPNDTYLGEEFSNGSSTTIRPEDFLK
jgi:co-chaperonin GroES (HSP10)